MKSQQCVKAIPFVKSLIATVLFGLSANLWANQPLTIAEEFFDDFPIVSCGDYSVRTSALTSAKQTFFFDRDGNPVRIRVSIHIRDAIYYNSEDSDIYIQQGASGTGENIQGHINLVNGTEQWSGVPFRITLKGIGPLYIEVGRNYWDGENWNFSGILVFPEAGTGSALCAALAP